MVIAAFVNSSDTAPSKRTVEEWEETGDLVGEMRGLKATEVVARNKETIKASSFIPNLHKNEKKWTSDDR